MSKWKYSRLSNDVFFLSLVLDHTVEGFEEVPAARALHQATREIGTFKSVIVRAFQYDEEGNQLFEDNGDPVLVDREDGLPIGPWHAQTAWRGDFELEDGVVFRVSALYGHPKRKNGKANLCLVCDTDEGYHDEELVMAWLEGVNGESSGGAEDQARKVADHIGSGQERDELIAHCEKNRDNPQYNHLVAHVRRWDRVITTLLGRPDGMPLTEIRMYAVDRGWAAWRPVWEAVQGAYKGE